MQEFFSDKMVLRGCGLKGVELLGEQEDWDRLVTKLHEVRKILMPVPLCMLGLDEGWFVHVEIVFRNLAKTFAASKTNDQKEGRGVRATLTNHFIAKFWADILMIGKGWTHGPSGMPGEIEVKEYSYNGWLVRFLTAETYSQGGYE